MGVVDVLEQRAREAAAASARLLEALLDVAADAPAGFDADEIAFALHWTSTNAAHQLRMARFLRDVLPAVFAAHRAGDLDAYRAWLFHDVLANATVETARAVADRVLPHAATDTGTQLRRRLNRALHALDAPGATERARRNVADRYLGKSPAGDGTANLVGIQLPAGRVLAAFERVDAIARGVKLGGDDRTLDQLRADVFLDLLDGTTPTAPAGVPIARRGVVDVVVSLDTAIGRGDEPGEIAGYGPLPADLIRELLTDLRGRRDVDWRYSVRDRRGELLRHGNLDDPARAGRQRATEAASSDGSVGHRPRRRRRTAAVVVTDDTIDGQGRISGSGRRDDATRPQSDIGGSAARAATRRHRVDNARNYRADNAGSQRAGNTRIQRADNARHQRAGNARIQRVDNARNYRADNARSQRAGYLRRRSRRSDAGPQPTPPVEADPTRRSPGPALKRWIIARDRTCRAPGCTMPAMVCDIDHTRRHTDGGLTTHRNLGLLCRRHHRLKDTAGWTLVQVRPGIFIWRSPRGRTYRTNRD
jgi:Domain of unknown function (DUF222)